MTDFGFVAGVIGLFVLFGVVFDVLAVIAASALRADAGRGRRKRASRARDDSGYGAGWPASGWSGGWTETTETGWEDPLGPDEGSEDNPPPRWPGEPGQR